MILYDNLTKKTYCFFFTSQKTPEPLPLFVSKAETCGTQGRLGDEFVKLKDERNERMNRKFCKNNGQKKHVSLELTPKILPKKVAKEKSRFFKRCFFKNLKQRICSNLFGGDPLGLFLGMSWKI